MKKIKTIILILLLFPLIHCGTFGAKTGNYPAQVDGAMKAQFAQADALYNSKDYTAALEGFQRYIGTYPYNKLADEAQYKIGKIYFLQAKWADASVAFDKLAKQTPDSAYRAKAYLMEGYSAIKNDDARMADSIFDRIEVDSLPTKLKIQYWSLKIKALEGVGAQKDDVDYCWLRLYDVYQGSADQALATLQAADVFDVQTVATKARSWILDPMNVDQIPRWFKTYPSGFSRASVLYKWGKAYFDAGRKDDAKEKLSQYVQAYPKHEFVSYARKMLNDLGGETKVAIDSPQGTVRIGVLLPLTGPQGTYGQAVLWGIQCGAGQQTGCEPATNFRLAGNTQAVELVIRDSGSDPTTVVAALDDLASQDIHFVIGPIGGALSEAAARRAEALKLVLLPITSKKGIMAISKNVYQMGYSAEEQAADIVRVAMNKGVKDFVIFYPISSYGQEMKLLFEKEVREQGGKMTLSESYEATNPDISGYIRNLKLALAQKEEGFKGIFIPDSYRSVNRIVDALSEQGMKDLLLMGTNAWGDSQLSSRLVQYFPGSFFVDLFNPSSSESDVAAFVKAFQASFGKAPTGVEAVGFDAVRFIQAAVSKANSVDVQAVSQALMSMEKLKGITHIDGFKNGEEPNIKPYILSVGDDGLGEYH